MLERPPGYNDIPSWLPQPLHGAYRALNDPLVQMTPMGMVGQSLPTGIRVMRTTGNVQQRNMLENALGTLRARVRPLTDTISDFFDARLKVGSKSLGAEGYSNYPTKQYPNTATRRVPAKATPIDVKIHPSELVPGNEQEIVRTILHEFLHPKVSTIRPELLGRMAPKALETLKGTPSAASQPWTNPTPNPLWYQGRDLLEELVVRMMEQNIVNKRLNK